MDAASKLRKLLRDPGPVVMPGVYDCLSVLSVQKAGFNAAFVSGAAVTASVLGYPDVGLQTMPEILGQVRNMARAADIPMLVDIDTGYGNALNMMRAIREFEHAGAGGVFFEDQGFPKKCGHFEGKKLIPVEEMVVKVKAACAARRNKDFVIVARTDARAEFGLAHAIERGKAYAAAGADVIFVEAMLSEEEMREVARVMPVPTQANLSEGGGKTPMIHYDKLHEMGFKFISYSGMLQRTAIKGMQNSLEALKREGSAMSRYPEHICNLADRSALLRLDKFYELEEQLYGPLLETEGSWRSELKKKAEGLAVGEELRV